MKLAKLLPIASSALPTPSPIPSIIDPTKSPNDLPNFISNPPPALIKSLNPGIFVNPPSAAKTITKSAINASNAATPIKAASARAPTEVRITIAIAIASITIDIDTPAAKSCSQGCFAASLIANPIAATPIHPAINAPIAVRLTLTALIMAYVAAIASKTAAIAPTVLNCACQSTSDTLVSNHPIKAAHKQPTIRPTIAPGSTVPTLFMILNVAAMASITAAIDPAVESIVSQAIPSVILST